MDKKGSILKDTPDYEQYTENEAVLTLEEQKEFGLLKCGGCCSKKSSGCCSEKSSGCNKGCCKSNK